MDSLVPEFVLTVPVVVAIVALVRKMVPIKPPAWIWTWVTLIVALLVAVACVAVGILQTSYTKALLNGLMVALAAVGAYDGLVKPFTGIGR